MSKDTFWKVQASASNPKVGELLLYGVISSESWWGDEVTPKTFKADLDALGDIDELRVFINSGGGDVFAGQSIHSMLQRYKEKAKVIVYVDGLAASIASVIAVAGDVVRIPRNAMMMIHNPAAGVWGNAVKHRRMADDLDKIRESLTAAYEAKTDLSHEKIIELMDAETWMTAEEAVEYGFADEIEEAKQVAASIDGRTLVVNGLQFDLSRFQNVPKMAPAPSAAQAPPTTVEKQAGDPGLLSLWAWQLQANRNRLSGGI